MHELKEKEIEIETIKKEQKDRALSKYRVLEEKEKLLKSEL